MITHDRFVGIAYVLGYGSFGETSKLCLDSLLSQIANHPNLKVVAIDNGSPDDSPSRLKAYATDKANLDCIYIEQNLGFAGGMNRCVEPDRSDWIILVNSDIVFPENSINALLNALQSAPEDVGMVTPLTNNAGNGQCLRFDETSELTSSVALHGLTELRSNLLVPIYRADFCCVAIRSALWKKLGGLDLSFGVGYFEDFEFSLRAKKEGGVICVSEDWFVFHAGSKSFKNRKAVDELIRKNKSILRNKHPEAIFEHARNETYRICSYIIGKVSVETDKNKRKALLFRLRLHINSLKHLQPKSLIKRAFWTSRRLGLENILRKFSK